MKNKKQVLLITPVLSSFIKSDIKLLSSNYKIKVLHFSIKPKIFLPIELFSQLLKITFNFSKSNYFLIQFGGYWSLLPALMGKLFNKPVFIILHGTDCCSLPEIAYGSLRKKIILKFCAASYKLASKLLPVSHSLVYVKNNYSNTSSQGLLNYFPNLSTPYEVIPNGLDFRLWHPSSQKKNDHTFIAVFSENQFILKGGDLIIEIAENFTNCIFYIAGSTIPKHLTKIPKNVIFLGKLSQPSLRSYFQQASFHLQLSLFEGFGMSLCEAMLCGCIPIVSSVNILPEIINGSGYVLNKKDPKLLKTIINKALSDPNKSAKRNLARSNIIEKYPLKKRKSLLIRELSIL